jgi:catechol 2,3-dioxygenase-like lactoylglutathione lyase family enzyme
MKRFHIHVAVDQIEESVRFYSALFGHAPTVAHADYAKWMLEDPRLNFAISQRGRKPGVNHVGFQVETPEELDELRARIDAASDVSIEQKDIACCYARSDKHWVTDPSGIAWESFRTLGEAVIYGESERVEEDAAPSARVPSACCAPASGASSRPQRGCC